MSFLLAFRKTIYKNSKVVFLVAFETLSVEVSALTLRVVRDFKVIPAFLAVYECVYNEYRHKKMTWNALVRVFPVKLYSQPALIRKMR